MGEKRKPDYILLLKIPSKNKTTKVELFKRELFTDKPYGGRYKKQQYRIRVKGKWFGGRHKFYYASWEIKELFWRGLPF